MDPIAKLISESDPMRRDPARLPEAAAELRAVVTEAEPKAQLIGGAPGSPSPIRPKKRRWPRVSVLAASLAVIAVAVLVVFLNVNRLPTPISPASGQPAVQNSGWQLYLEGSGQLSFEYPPGWQAQESFKNDQNGGEIRTVAVRNPAGAQIALLSLERGVAYPELCQLNQGVQLVDTVPLQLPVKSIQNPNMLPGKPSFVFRVSPDAVTGEVRGAILLRNESSTPNIGGCLSPDRIYAPDGIALIGFGDEVTPAKLDSAAPLTFKDLAAAKAYQNTEEYQTLKKILTSLRFR
ncbi:hypothetical protein [Psychromicrobium lacuslunae]|uniref:Uncharacterized protein n=1 Tax=Psychromicrobium lacuslunae TaxID=1618207 RepID=A0A0D4BWH3_9MICC|nr:hypothetical protein [Psychromicrobium lacuslunae]AJT40654.1 hypothetical protein UM93_02335 [Psychromicrobium lacuslunae]